MFNKFFSPKIFLLLDNAEKYCTVEQATNDNMAHAHFMLNTEGYKTTLGICNTYCFSTAKK